MAARGQDRSADAAPAALELVETADGTEVRLPGIGLVYRHSFVHGELARRARQTTQALLRACDNKQRQVHRVLDLTAGWGADALTLASHGFEVTMLECEPRIYRVLKHALECLSRTDAALASRLHLVNDNAAGFLQAAKSSPGFDCIYLDPMFPAHKSGARPGKSMQILQAITANQDIELAFELALTSARRRIVVKRPAKAPSIDARKPAIEYRERSIRFDVYLPGDSARAGDLIAKIIEL